MGEKEKEFDKEAGAVLGWRLSRDSRASLNKGGSLVNIEYVQVNGTDIAVVSGDQAEIGTPQAALELAMTVKYEAGAERVAIDKEALGEDFFILSTGAAGEILQKFVNYHVKAAVFGDYSRYTSKPLRDFIHESNKGRHFFFAATREEALERLSQTN